MTIPQFKRWLAKKRKELAQVYDRDLGGEYSTYRAGKIAEEASRHAADLHLPELMRVWAEQVEVPVVDQYLVECMTAISSSDALTPPEVAEQLSTSPETVLGWIKSGQLKASNLATGNRPRYVVMPDDLTAFLKSRQPDPPVKRKAKAKPTGSYNRFSE